MDELNAWSMFCATGSVLDYLHYASMKNSQNYFPEEEAQEDSDENQHRWTDYQGTEYR